MDTYSEKKAFSERLQLALKALPNQPLNLSQIALQFNLRWHKDPVSPQAVHKWLTAQYFPTHEKLKVLAEWLNVSYEWLRYGRQTVTTNNEQEVLMLTYFNKLTKDQQQAVLNLLSAIVPDKS